MKLDGYLGHLSDDQAKILEEFRGEYESFLETDLAETDDKYLKPETKVLVDVLLLRFLRARNFNLKKATTLLKDSHNMRQKYGANKIYQKNGLLIMKHPGAQMYACDSGLTDPEGRPIGIGRINVMAGPDMEHEPHIAAMGAFIELLLNKSNPQADGLVYVLDLVTKPGAAGSKHGLRTLHEALKRVNIVYPEAAHKIFMINSSFTFRMIWKVAGLLLTERTHSKIEIMSSNYQELLLSKLPAECLFGCFGGTAEGPGTLEELDAFILAAPDRYIQESAAGNNLDK
mmetsp:Transcript_14821/g.18326  ORF Transcript_14821/g.18326 Transcript_14821/m.18326 type:complete len:286 (-) Transcript_14821:107-964(-)|eukprot:CAMPEP_0204844050 /NCGR_PEP_ID=MMETSP1346-20131115/48337_1 /ASSEMBLY_ACC=CAM_ASM_000771 /TAXON_ID=215587 /ORGANISM="Aplanochytrium stocchinoi, Strain GSBS06" /LENGTH=285 /DNA_ID=CAMNT_0051983295 /DNA_START=199 /DNA_END=1056 /DNA_ORIENTATION=+